MSLGRQPLVPKRMLQWSEVGSEVVILDQSARELLRLNPVAGFIWKQLDGQRNVAEIAEALWRHFAIEKPTAERDVAKFLRELMELEIVEGQGS